jgi:hypothetical protein
LHHKFTPYVLIAVEWDLFPVGRKNHLRKLKFRFLHPGLPLFQMPPTVWAAGAASFHTRPIVRVTQAAVEHPRTGTAQTAVEQTCFYFCSMQWNSEHFYLPRNRSERNSESFLFRGTAGIPSELTICSVYSVFRGIIFLSDIANPSTYSVH